MEFMNELDRTSLEMADLFKQGHTLQEIANRFGMSKQAVHKRIKPLGIKRQDGGARAKSIRRLEAIEQRLQARREALAMKRYGCSYERSRQIIEAGLPRAYAAQKSASRTRGIEFHLSFAEWLQVWLDSGHLDDRGTKAGCYVMSRYRDVGPYALGNVFIQLHSENIREGFANKRQSGISGGAAHVQLQSGSSM